jgi:predicted nucleic acid-binding protein
LIEFISVVTRRKGGRNPLLPNDEAYRQLEGFMTEFSVVYPNEYVVQTAMRGMATYRLSWFDAHLWAYADHYGIQEILSEDFEHGRIYGSVRVRNPFAALGLA